MRPPYPRTRGIAPGPILRYRRLLFQTSFRVLSEERRSRGSSPPVPPRQGHRPCTRSATRKTERSNFFPHETSGNGKRAHGRNENEEKSRSGKFTFLPVFSHFPRMQKHPAGGVSHRPARGRQCRSHLAKQLLFFCEQVCACCFAAPAHCLQNEDCKSGTGSRGNAPCGVGRGNAPPSFPTLHREIACVIRIAISGVWVQG